MIDQKTEQEILDAVLSRKKYHRIAPDLIRSIIRAELDKGRKKKPALKAVLSKLHQIGSAYFSLSPSYQEWENELNSLPKELGDVAVKSFCKKILQTHSSSSERMPIMNRFFKEILSPLKPINSILDLACGFNPLAIPWMPIHSKTKYTGCDIFQDMIGFLNTFYTHFEYNATFYTFDLLNFEIPGAFQIAFILKSLPCLNQINKGVGTEFLDAIPAEWIVVSYPIGSLSGKKKGMRQHYTQQFQEIIEGRNWLVKEFLFPTELAFLIKK